MLEKDKCTGCMACACICPRNAISIIEDEGKFLYPKINYDYCNNCNLCERVCPVISKCNENNYIGKALACINKDEKIRMQSSSGGIFSLIAEHIIKNNGIVFGVSLNDELEVVHTYAENVEDLKKFRGSKYVQSNIDKTYSIVKKFLDEGRKVLFTGTPCQVEGLYSFLRKEYLNLYTQDIICHGVPAPQLLEKYIQYKEKDNQGKINKVSFRDKENLGWSNFQLKIDYETKNECMSHDEDPFMQLFLRDIALRKTCYDCNFKRENRISDITLADFWGINNVLPEMNDEKGISAVMINSEKGMELFENIKEKIIYKETTKKEIQKYNPNFVKSAKKFDRREEFFKDLENKDFEYLIEKYL